MIIFINEKEAAALTLHMSVMRKSFRNLLKRQFKAEQKEFQYSYDYIHDEARKALEGEYNAYALNMNIKDLEILKAFLDAYIVKTVRENEMAQIEELKEHLDVLSGVRNKANECICA